MNILKMVEQERQEWDLVNNDGIPIEAYLRIKQLSPWPYHRKGKFEHTSIQQWLYYGYPNWLSNIDRKAEDSKDE